MIDLNENDDPLLFRAQVPAGSLIVQWNEMLAVLAKPAAGEPGVQDVAAAIRKVSRTPEVATQSTDEVLFAVFARMGKAVEAAGN